MKKGFTLIEVITAIAVISLLILAISGLTGLSIKMNMEADRRDEIFNIARSICEIYKSNADNYSSVGSEISIYKYINDISDIKSINALILSKNGNYEDSDYHQVVNNNCGYKYTLILKIKRVINAGYMELLYIEAIRNDEVKMRITMNAAK